MAPLARPVLALLLLVPAPTLGVVMALVVAPGPLGQAVWALCKLWILCLPFVWLRWVERRPPSLSPPRRGGFLAAFFLGLLMSGFVYLAYTYVGGRWIEVEAFQRRVVKMGLGNPVAYLGFAAYTTLVNSLLEEYVWRWFVFRRCEDLLPGPAAVAASALFFTLHHAVTLQIQLGWQTALLSSLGIFVGAAVWSWCYLRYRSIWPGYLSHVIVDVTALWIGYQLLFA